MDERIREILDYFGDSNQQEKAIEEAAEFIQAMIKYRLDGSLESAAHVREEMADLEIMIDQMKLIFGDLKDVREFKLRRTLKRIGDMRDEH